MSRLSEAKRLVRKWAKLFRLGWDIKVCFQTEKEDPDIVGKDAVISIYGYRQAKIGLSHKLKSEEIEAAIIHELMHLVVTECFPGIEALAKKRDDLHLIWHVSEEALVQRVEAVIVQLVKGG